MEKKNCEILARWNKDRGTNNARKNLLSLYNAVNGSSYEDQDALDIVTPENAIYMGMESLLNFFEKNTRLLRWVYSNTTKREEERKLRKAEYEVGKEEGIKEGELQKAKETAAVMNKMKFPVEKIAEVLQVDKNAIMEWIKEK